MKGTCVKDDGFWSDSRYSVHLPLFHVSGRLVSALKDFLRSHVVKQVESTCLLFDFLPNDPLSIKLAQIASMAGSEEFYCVVLPIMTWSIASFDTSRALVALLCMNLYIGNCLKNLLCLPRPPMKYRFGAEVEEEPSCVDSLGFGWPSTHSCNAVSLPFAALKVAYGSILPSASYADMSPVETAAYFAAFLYAVAVPFSRLVLGVHSAADVHAGMLYGCVNLRLWLLYHEMVGEYMNSVSISFIALGTLALLALHPRVKPENYTFEESVCIVGYTMGFILGSYWSQPLDLKIVVDDDATAGNRCLRIIVGYGIVLPAKEFFKYSTAFMRTKIAYHEDGSKDMEKYRFRFGDFISRLLQYGFGFGVGCTLFAPYVFTLIGV